MRTKDIKEWLANITNKIKSIVDWTLNPHITKDNTTEDTYFVAERSDTGVSVGYGIGSGGTNHGIWSYKANKWVIYCDGSNVFVNGINTSNLLQKSQLIAELKTWDNITVAKGATTEYTYSVAKSGYTPIGVVGFDCNNASSSGTNMNYVWFSACRLNGSNVLFQMHNSNSSSAAKVALIATILYKAN